MMTALAPVQSSDDGPPNKSQQNVIRQYQAHCTATYFSTLKLFYNDHLAEIVNTSKLVPPVITKTHY